MLGFGDKPGFEQNHSVKQAAKAMIEAIEEDIRDHDYHLGAILLECSEFPLYRTELREHFGVTVRSMLTGLNVTAPSFS